jgi:hypothetical protein
MYRESSQYRDVLDGPIADKALNPWCTWYLLQRFREDYGVGRRIDSSTLDENTQCTEWTASSKIESVPSTAVSQLDNDSLSCHQNTHDHSSGELRWATSISNRNHSLKRNSSLKRASGPSTGRKKARRTEDTVPMFEGPQLVDLEAFTQLAILVDC